MLALVHTLAQGANERQSPHSEPEPGCRNEKSTEKKNGKKRKQEGSGYWIGAKEDNSDKMWKGFWYVSFYFLPPPAALSVRARLSEGRGTQRGEQKPSSAHKKPLTLISLRALQRLHGIILALTLIDWCQRPSILSKWALMSYNAWLQLDMF